MNPVVLRPAAAADIEQAALWYEQRRKGLGGEFLARVADAVDRISNSPKSYPILHKDLRRALLQRFPYAIWYTTQSTDDRVLIVACLHCKQSRRRIQT